MSEHDRRTHEILGDPIVWAETPDVLGDVLSAIEEGFGEPRVGGALQGPEEPRVERSRRTVGWRGLLGAPGTLGWRGPLWLPVGMAVVGVMIALAAFLASREDPPDFTLAGTEFAPEATAEVRIVDTPAGIILRLEVEGLEPAPPGTYYQGWVVSDDAAVSVGTFHMRGGDGQVAFWSGVETERYPTLVVTLQEERAGPARSDHVVLVGRT